MLGRNGGPPQVVRVAAPGEAGADMESLELLSSPKKEAVPVPPWKPQLAMAATQAMFVVGSVYLKGSMQKVDSENGETFHPIVYAFFREIVAGPLLFLAAWAYVGLCWPKRSDLMKLAGLGVCLFLSQLFYITGIELSGVVVATCMQPVIPVFTATLGVVFKMESAHPQKFVGIGMAVVGAVCMVLGGIAHKGASGGHVHSSSAGEGGNMMMGNLCLLINTLAMSFYYILAKQVVQKYHALLVAAWAYLTGAACMGLAAAIFTDAADWRFPRALLGPLIYWILVCSVMGYYVVTWATRILPASQVASFQCLQPFLGTMLAFCLLGEQPSKWDLGAIGIVAGLLLIVKDRELEPTVTRFKKMMSSHSLSSLLEAGSRTLFKQVAQQGHNKA